MGNIFIQDSNVDVAEVGFLNFLIPTEYCLNNALHVILLQTTVITAKEHKTPHETTDTLLLQRQQQSRNKNDFFQPPSTKLCSRPEKLSTNWLRVRNKWQFIISLELAEGNKISFLFFPPSGQRRSTELACQRHGFRGNVFFWKITATWQPRPNRDCA